MWLVEPVFELPQYIQQSPVQQFLSSQQTEQSKGAHLKNAEIKMSNITSNGDCNTTNKSPYFYVNSGITNDHLYDQLKFVTDENEGTTLIIETPLSHTTTAKTVSSFDKADCTSMSSPSNFPAFETESLKLCEDNPCLSYSKHECAQPRCIALQHCIEDHENRHVHGTSYVCDHLVECTTRLGYCLQVGCPPTHFLDSNMITEFKDTTTEILASDAKKENPSEHEKDITTTMQVCESSTHDKQRQAPFTASGSLNATLLSSENNCGLLPEAKPQDILVVIDNSNIYIGAQEYASSVNPSDRKRNVRVKLQHLVKILERGRNKGRAFACGSSPPSTETVWEMYRWVIHVTGVQLCLFIGQVQKFQNGGQYMYHKIFQNCRYKGGPDPGGGGYLGHVLLDMCSWPLRTPTPL